MARVPPQEELTAWRKEYRARVKNRTTQILDALEIKPVKDSFEATIVAPPGYADNPHDRAGSITPEMQQDQKQRGLIGRFIDWLFRTCRKIFAPLPLKGLSTPAPPAHSPVEYLDLYATQSETAHQAFSSDTHARMDHGRVRAVGFDACRAGLGKDTNPYPDGSDEFYLWLVGYNQAR